MTNNYKLSYEELFDLTDEIYPHQLCLKSDSHVPENTYQIKIIPSLVQ